MWANKLLVETNHVIIWICHYFNEFHSWDTDGTVSLSTFPATDFQLFCLCIMYYILLYYNIWMKNYTNSYGPIPCLTVKFFISTKLALDKDLNIILMVIVLCLRLVSKIITSTSTHYFFQWQHTYHILILVPNIWMLLD